ncbi:hypothetical protein PPYR_12130 [Photinus pyralis]|uniref:protein-serine/threonine phosphatase n=1 Tax=Photinus pyralis TaxID=7054 RepID=A0A1Y1M5J2_PHOPY|nr:probable protein phosphatase 2C 60 [Photinus pyralis]KAB0795291.1 hypothetical protein PPYR_12130 [Photinus pyralis]
MGSYLAKPITEKISTDEENHRLKIGASSMQGWRVSQEDAHNCLLDFDVNTALFAVYDGHGGHEVAHYCAQKLPDFIKSCEPYKSNDLEKALEESFLGFDATIETPKVITQLKEIAGAKETQNESDNSDVEENVSNLYEEATMPLEQVIEKYTSNLKHPHMLNLQKDDDKQPVSPYLRAKKDGPSVNEPSSSGEGIGTSSGSSQSVVNHKTEEVQDETKVEKSSDAKEEKPVQNGETVVPAVENNVDGHQENGEIVKKGKGKALAKTKGVPMPSPIKTRPKRNAQQLYSTLLKFESESESEDEEDKTFQGPNDNSGSDDEDNKLDEGDNSSSELGEEETDELEEEDIEEEEEGDCDSMDETDLEFARNMREEPGSDSGCTAVVALLRENQLYVANAGDSRCIVCRNGKAVDMSLDHKPEDDLETQRILKAGGRVTHDGRVNGGLNLSRAIGDHAYKQNKELSDREQMITALPDVKTLTINPGEDEFMVLACDGIWNFMSSQQVVDFVKSKLESSPGKLSKICEEMFDYCLAPDTMCDGTGCDNMTAIIVQFKSSVCKRAATDDEETESVKRAKTDHTEATV